MDFEFIALVLLTVPVVYVVIPTVLNMILRIRFRRCVGRSNRIFITFDDGPDPLQTPKILEELERYGVEATFFMVGEKIEKYPELVAAVRAAGHEIGEHSYRHYHPWYADPISTLLDLTRCGKIIGKARDNGHCILFRPPFGKFNIVTYLYTILGRKKNVFWSVDLTGYGKTGRAAGSPASLDGIKPGTVVLLHEAKERELAKDLGTVETLRTVLDVALSKGIKAGNLRKLLES